tara:strand:- start:987 stop:1445 length:459 start_codon:yes stop_codon:yes gene_type:complete
MSNYNIQKSSIVNVKFGKNIKIVDPVNLYNCLINDEVFIGPFVEIQSNVNIGKNTRIQSHSFICDGVTIGNNCFISHGVIFTNDDFKQGKPSGKDNLKKTRVGNNVSIGSNATILPINICEDVVIGAGSVVTKDIKISGIYAGNPAKFLRKI